MINVDMAVYKKLTSTMSQKKYEWHAYETNKIEHSVVVRNLHPKCDIQKIREELNNKEHHILRGKNEYKKTGEYLVKLPIFILLSTNQEIPRRSTRHVTVFEEKWLEDFI
ncbi:hypothetical protein JTB14_013627 [Gonioctena quinquepunctata]|nr:hypothetical protein JTB14_013627 [Gonioctena quinquepunctata]